MVGSVGEECWAWKGMKSDRRSLWVSPSAIFWVICKE